MKRASLQNTNSDEFKLIRVQSGLLKTSYSRIKSQLILMVALILLCGSLSAQDNKASVALSAAIYQEEVSGNLDKAVELYLDILKKYPNDRQVCAKTLYRLGLVNEKMGKQKADEYFTRLVNTYPDQTEMVTLAKAKLTLYNKDTEESTRRAQQSFNLAADLFKQYNYKTAIAEYEKVIALAPKSQLAQEAQLWIGHCYFKQGENKQALQAFNTIIKEFPGSSMIPVTELMINQVKQAIAKEPKKSSIVKLDEKTILDPNTGIKFTKVNCWAGKNDIIQSSSSITDISPNRKFLLAENKIIPFNNGVSFNLYDSLSYGWISRLSPDGTQIATLSEHTISLIHVFSETGQVTGSAKQLLSGQFNWQINLNNYASGLNWSLNGDNLVYSAPSENSEGASLWTLSIKDGLAKKVPNSDVKNRYSYHNPIFSKNGENILFTGGGIVKMKSIESGNSVTLLDSCAGYILSPDNRWIMYLKIQSPDLKKYLFRLIDKQEQELSPPEEVGDFVSWADESSKVFFYKPSYEKLEVLKVASIYGGPAFELEKHYGMYSVGWSKNSDAIIAKKLDWGKNNSLSMINLIDQSSKIIDGIENPGAFPSFSPDFSKLLVGLNYAGQASDITLLPFSLKDSKVTGKPILIYKGFNGYNIDCSWSPDGKKIAVCSDGEVWICSAEGGAPHQLTKTELIEKFPLWSPDGKALSVYIRSTNQLRIINSSDGEVLVTFEDVDNGDWMNQGDEIIIAFQNGEINAISITSGKSRKIANRNEMIGCSEFFELKCSPDGNWIALSAYNDELARAQMFTINISTGKISELVSDDTANKESFLWSPDSKWISYFTNGPKKVRLEGTLWEADLTDFMKTIKPGTEKGYTTDFDFKTHAIPEGGVAADGIFTDARDGHVYKYKKIGEQTWMAENLAYLPEVNPNSDTSSVDKRYYIYGYEGSEVMAAKKTENYQKYGVLYNWPAAMNGITSSNAVPGGIQGSCPSGWHVPSDKEWLILEKTLGMSEAELAIETGAYRSSGSVDKKLLSPSIDDDDILIGQSGFNAPLGGLIFRAKGTSINRISYFLTATSFNDNQAVIRFILPDKGVYRQPAAGRSLGLSVRCVKD